MGGRVMEWSSAPRGALLQSGGVRRADGSHRLLPGRGSGRSRALAAVVRGATVGPRGMLMAKKRWILSAYGCEWLWLSADWCLSKDCRQGYKWFERK